MRKILRPLLVLATCASAYAVPFTVTFSATEIPDQSTADFDLEFSVTTQSYPGGFFQTVHYDLASQTFSVISTSALESFTAVTGSNSFQDVWTFDEALDSTVNVQLQTTSPQSFSNRSYSNVFGEGNSGFFFGDYTVADPVQPGSITFNLDDPGSGGIVFAPLAATGGAPEMDPAGLQMALAFFAIGFGVLASHKKFSPGLASQ